MATQQTDAVPDNFNIVQAIEKLTKAVWVLSFVVGMVGISVFAAITAHR